MSEKELLAMTPEMLRELGFPTIRLRAVEQYGTTDSGISESEKRDNAQARLEHRGEMVNQDELPAESKSVSNGNKTT